MTQNGRRAQAAALRQQAARTRDPAVREQLELMATNWDKLADHAEELERRRRASGG